MLKTHTTSSPSPSLIQPQATQDSYLWVRLIGFFLFFQSGALFVVSVYLIRWLNDEFAQNQDPFLLKEMEALWGSRFFVPLAIVAFFAAINFMLLRPLGWLLSMLVQTFTLLFALILYFRWDSTFVYPIMLYSAIMVLYLNSSYVRRCFDNKSRSIRDGHS